MNWENEARRILRAELVRRGVTYQQLGRRLQAVGIKETERSIANKMSRGTFSFVFVLQCLKAIGVESVSFDLTEDVARADPAPTRRRQIADEMEWEGLHVADRPRKLP
jgi:Domain of unknown function (DUF6471)